MPNLLLVLGNGRNVGKTYLACKIIQHLSKNDEVIGLKITPHFHQVKNSKVLYQTSEFVIIEEDQINQKDSSLMLQSGAKKVYFIMASQENLKKAFLQLNDLLPDKAIVCESGGLIEIAEPGISLFVNRIGREITKNQYLKFFPKLVINDGEDYDLDISKIRFKNNRFSIQ